MSGQLRVTKVHHACVIVEDDHTRILIDPGQLGPGPSLDGIAAVLVTHSHFDHLDPSVINAAVASAIPVWAPADVVDSLGEGVHEAVAGTTISIGTLAVAIAGDRHAEMHPDLPGPPNRAYLIGGSVFVTGDAHPAPPSAVTALVTPINAPWLRVTDLISYVRTISPAQFIGVHDGLLNEAGLAVATRSAATLAEDGVPQSTVAADGETIVVADRAS